MPLLAAICACFLMFYSGYVYDQVKTDVSYLVTHLYIMTSLLLCGMVRSNKRESRKSKDEPTGSGKVSSGTEGESSKDK